MYPINHNLNDDELYYNMMMDQNQILDPEQAVLQGIVQAQRGEDNDDSDVNNDVDNSHAAQANNNSNSNVDSSQLQPSANQSQAVAANSDLSQADIAKRLRRHGRAHGHHIDNINQIDDVNQNS